MASWRAVTSADGNMHTRPRPYDREPGSPNRYNSVAALCVRLPGGLPGRRVRGPRLEADPPVHRLGVATGLAGRVLLYADRRAVRDVPLHGHPPGPGAFHPK